MRLDRMREFKFTEKLNILLQIHKSKLRFPEQDLLNIMFHNETGENFILNKIYFRSYSLNLKKKKEEDFLSPIIMNSSHSCLFKIFTVYS